MGRVGEGSKSQLLRLLKLWRIGVPEFDVGISQAEYLEVVRERVGVDISKLDEELKERKNEFARISKGDLAWRTLLLRLQREALAAFPSSILSSKAKSFLARTSREASMKRSIRVLDRDYFEALGHIQDARRSMSSTINEKPLQRPSSKSLSISQYDRGLVLALEKEGTKTIIDFLSATRGPLVVEHCIALGTRVGGSRKGGSKKIKNLIDSLRQRDRKYRVFEFSLPSTQSTPCSLQINMALYGPGT